MKPQAQMARTVIAHGLGLGIRLVQRAVEWPVAVVFGMMVFFGLILGLGTPGGGINVLSGLALYVFIWPLETTRGPVNEINGQQAMWLAGIWYAVYVILAELVAMVWRRRRPQRAWSIRKLTFVILAIGYTAIGIVGGFNTTGVDGFSWSILTVTWGAVVVGGVCLAISAGLEAAGNGIKRLLLRN